jgi:TetR/AcrR family transcriptional regulator
VTQYERLKHMVNMATPSRRRSGLARGRRGRDARDTREGLLTAATQLFAARGFEGVSVAQIAHGAGVTKALVNYHFGGKRKLYLAIITSTFAEIVERVEQLVASGRPAPDQLREFVALVGEMATTRRPHFPAMMLREALAGGTHVTPEVVPYLMRVLGAVRRVVEQGVRDGTLRPVNPLFTHLSLIGSLLFFFATASFRERIAGTMDPPLRTPPSSDYVRHVQELIARGLAADTKLPATARSIGADT